MVYVFKQQFSVFKQHFTYFKTLFHPHVFPQIFLNNNFQFLNTHTKRAQIGAHLTPKQISQKLFLKKKKKPKSLDPTTITKKKKLN